MIHKVYSIRDTKSGVYWQPLHQKTHGEAERTFKSLVEDEKTLIHKYPEDFELYYLGEFNDETGKVDFLDTPQHVVAAVQLKQH